MANNTSDSGINNEILNRALADRVRRFSAQAHAQELKKRAQYEKEIKEEELEKEKMCASGIRRLLETLSDPKYDGKLTYFKYDKWNAEEKRYSEMDFLKCNLDEIKELGMKKVDPSNYRPPWEFEWRTELKNCKVAVVPEGLQIVCGRDTSEFNDACNRKILFSPIEAKASNDRAST